MVTFDNTANTKVGRLSSGIRAVEFSSINQGSAIVHANTIRSAWAFGSFTLCYNLVLKAAGQYNNPFFGSILLKELLTLPQVVLFHVCALGA